MPADQNNLVWIDMEMTGLVPEIDRVIEVAMLVTNAQLEPVAEGVVYVVHQPDSVLDGMDAWNKGAHGRSGLIERVRNSVHDEAAVQDAALEFLARHVPANVSPMCGNSICQDRRFLARWMPRLEAYFHYRNLDVSTLKELVKRWRPDLAKGFVKASRHEALPDILESIEELKYYRSTVMTI